MAFLKQLILGLAVIAVTLAIWIAYVPGAADMLDRMGLLDLLGIERAQSDDGDTGGRRWGGGGPAQVVTAPVALGVLDDRITAIGDGRALRSVTVRAEATGRITEIDFEAGTHVDKGAVIFRLDAEAERIAVERARLKLGDARDEADRLSRLEGSGTVTTVRTREAQLALQIAELDLRQAEFDLAQREIRAPIAGWIGLTETSVGDRVNAQEALGVITDRSRILIDFRVPERVIGQLDVGMALEATPLAMPGTTLKGEVSAIDNVVDRASRTLRVQGRLDNEGDRLRAGMAFSVTLAFEGERYPAIDPLALQWSSDGAFVWAVRDGKAQRVTVVIRQRNADSVLVEADLEPGEPVVTEGVQTLRPGAEVSIANEAAAQAAEPAPARL